MGYGPEIFLTDEELRERRNLAQLEVSQIEEERRREDDACKHAEQRSVEREEEMAKKLDRYEAAFLAALQQDDPEATAWTASWRVGGLAEPSQDPATAFAVAKRLHSRKLLDKQPGRSSEIHNGYAINAAARDALGRWHSAQAKVEADPS